ncbi:G5 domain-containing protein [Peptoniphilaceae bacterium SGI.097]
MQIKKLLKGQLRLMAGILVISCITGSWAYAQRPKEIDLTIDGTRVELFTTEKNIREALLKSGYTDLEGAESTTALDNKVEDGMELSVRTLKTITIKDAGVDRILNTLATNVGELLQEQNITLNQDDTIEPARSAALKEGDVIVIDRYETTTTSENQPVDYETKTVSDDSLFAGDTRVVTEGVSGTREIVTATTTKNGEVISTEVVSDTVTQEPVTEVIAKGTKTAPKSEKLYSLAQFRFQGVVNYSGYKYTYYSQSVLPGGGLRIPGRHINADGYVCDGDGYIVLAGSAAMGTVYPTPFGALGKIYDRGTTGNHLDVYIR